MEFIFLLFAVLIIAIIWIARTVKIFEHLKAFRSSKNKKELKGILKVLQLFGFDALITLLTYVVFGKSKTLLALKMIIWLNALTTFLGKLFIKIIKKVSKI